MAEIYKESRALREIIEGHGWNLYDATQPENSKVSFKWDELEARGLAQEFEIDRNYVFAPIPEKGQSQRDAYSITKGLGPSLVIEDPDDERWGALYVNNHLKERPVLFTRLLFDSEVLVAMTPRTRDIQDPDLICIQYTHVIDTFEKYFRIVSPDEYGLTTPIPMPFHLEDN